jgi:hypothetical protein
VYNPVAEDLGIKCGNVIISINGQGALTLPEVKRNTSMILMGNFSFDANAAKCKTFFCSWKIIFYHLAWTI